MVELTFLLVLALPIQSRTPKTNTPTEPLKLLISIEQQSITSPFPARITLHLHNSGQEPLWLYRRARSPEAVSRREARPPEATEGTASYTSGGSTLRVQLEPAQRSGVAKPAQGAAFDGVGLPHPKLIKLDPDEDYEEKTVIQLAPALAELRGEPTPIWGRYRLSVVYGARFSNAEEISRNLGLKVWEGEVVSNTIEVELHPAGAGAQGSAAGTVVGPRGHALPDIVVSLSDEREHVIGQTVTGPEGRFSFTQLPLGLYWVTARLANSSSDTVVFRHLELTTDQPAGAVEVVMSPPEIYEPKGMLHKPVLFRVRDSAGRPLDKVTLEITWSNGTVMDNVKGQVSDDGTTALDLIPGRNFVTLKRHGCAKQEQRVDVAEGNGFDDFGLAFDCARK